MINSPYPFREHPSFDSWHNDPVYYGVTPDVATELPIEYEVAAWSEESNYPWPTWPIQNENIPRYLTPGNKRYKTTLVSGDTLLVIYDVHFMNTSRVHKDRDYRDGYIEVHALQRKPSSEYWPTEEQCSLLADTWSASLYSDMQEYVGFDCMTTAFASNAEHWLEARRRYGTKNNPTSRLAFITGIDPEGRHRCLCQPLPNHVERWLRYADFMVGVKSGINPDEITANDIYSSEAVINDDEMLSWCKNTFLQRNNS